MLGAQEQLRTLRARHPEIVDQFIDPRLLDVALFRFTPREALPEGVRALLKKEDRADGSAANTAQRLKGGRAKISSRARGRAPAPVPGGGGAEGESLGRSRGGLTTKIHLSADGKCRPLSLIITPGQRADCTQFKPVLEKIRVPKIGPGRPRKKPDSVAADKAYSNRPCREYLRHRGIRHTIPEKTDQQQTRAAKGSHGGRPPAFDPEAYKQRNTVERAHNKLKAFRAVAMRTDKREFIFHGTIDIASIKIWLRHPAKQDSADTP